MADEIKENLVKNSTFDQYLRTFVIYVAKNPREFVFYVFAILSPFMLVCAYLSWKLMTMIEQETKDKKRKGTKKVNVAKTRRKNKAKPE